MNTGMVILWRPPVWCRRDIEKADIGGLPIVEGVSFLAMRARVLHQIRFSRVFAGESKVLVSCFGIWDGCHIQ